MKTFAKYVAAIAAVVLISALVAPPAKAGGYSFGFAYSSGHRGYGGSHYYRSHYYRPAFAFSYSYAYCPPPVYYYSPPPVYYYYGGTCYRY
jgi:hypothetical protein